MGLDFAPWEDDADGEEEAQLDAAATFAREVTREVRRLQVREEARTRFAAEKSGEVPPFDVGTLAELLARPQSARYRVDGLIPAEAAALVSAQRKTGKTTLGLNLARSLTTGEDFLGRFGVDPLSGNVGILNFEVSGATLAGWADDARVPHDRLVVANLRGRRNPLVHPEDRAELTAYLRAHEVEAVMVDPFGRAFTGQSQNDAGEVGAWLADLDRWTRSEVGATDLVLTAHAGWNGERTRGSSSLEDWADVVLTLTRGREDDQETPERFLKAFGRDVEVEEDQLEWEPATRSMMLTGAGSRRATEHTRAIETVLPQVLDYVADNPGCSQRAVEAAVGGHAKTVRDALHRAVDGQQIKREQKGRSYIHHPMRPCVPNASGRIDVGASMRPIGDAPTNAPCGAEDDGTHTHDEETPTCRTCGQVPDGKAGLGSGGQCSDCELQERNA